MNDPAASAWHQAMRLVAEETGLHFPTERLADFRRGLAAAAPELELAGAEDCIRLLLSAHATAAQMRILVSHLTVGETYFFRGREQFDALARHVLPTLIEKRRRSKQLHIWSAGCCTGEEAYSLAIVLRQLLPDLPDWRVDLVGTDINDRFLARAAEAVYGSWSFRDTPAEPVRRHFAATADGRFAVAPEIRRMVSFAPLNLVAADFATRATQAGVRHGAVDLILCRNVLMYFRADQARRATGHLRGALASDGYLMVAPCEIPTAQLPGLSRSVFADDVVVFGKQRRTPRAQPLPTPPRRTTPAPMPVRAAPALQPVAVKPSAQPSTPRAETVAARARRLADQGRLAEALQTCERWIATEKLDASAHYLRAMILIETGDRRGARESLQRTLYLDPQAPLAHLALGNLDRASGRQHAAGKHFRTALNLLCALPAERVLDAAKGVTAGQAHAALAAMLETESAA